ncbi:MAG: T9SS type A sorting domain-containing protein [Ignavibacteriae bacterium]|nr:T9SS type A sorting domain-containing protein [Ignavibacteriota bacterium]
MIIRHYALIGYWKKSFFVTSLIVFVMITMQDYCYPQWTHVGLTGYVSVLHKQNDTLLAGSGLVYRSTDYGNHWDALEDPYVFNVSTIETINETILVGGNWGCIYCEERSPAVSRSQDYGNTWTTVLSSYYGVQSILKSNRHIFTNPDGMLYRSDDGGANWNRVPSDSIFGWRTYLLYADETELYAANENQLFYTTNEGETWHSMTTGWGNAYVYSLVKRDSLLFTGTSYGVYRSTNHGVNWEKNSPGTNISFALLLFGDNLFAVWSDSIYTTKIDSLNWQNVSAGLVLPDYRNISSLAYAGKYLFAGTNYGVWRRPLSEMVPLDEIKVKRGWNLISLPAITTDCRKTDLFPTATSHAFSYNSSTYTQHDTLQKGIGYWIKFSSEQKISIIGSKINIDTINVQPGWNMIGAISNPVPVGFTTFIPQDMQVSEFFKYDRSYFTADTLLPGKGYWIKVNQDGKLILSSSTTMGLSNRINIVSDEESPPPPPDGEITNLKSQIPNHFALSQNYPNPFNPITIFRYQLSEDVHVRLSVFNTLGVEVAALIDGVESAGYKSLEFDASSLPSGVYFYRLQAGTFTDVKKMLLTR